MSNTTKLTDRFLQIKGLNADWTLAGDLAGFKTSGIVVKSITFQPGAANDVAIVKAGKGDQTAAVALATTGTAPEIFHVKCVNTKDQRVKYFGKGKRMWPFIVIADWTLAGGTIANARIEFELA